MFFVKECFGFTQHMPGLFLRRLAISYKISHIFKFPDCIIVACFVILKGNICNKDYLLTEVIKGDDLIKEHKIKITEVFGILGIKIYTRLHVLQVIVGEVAHKTPGKCWQVLEIGTFVFSKDLTDITCGITGLYCHAAGL